MAPDHTIVRDNDRPNLYAPLDRPPKRVVVDDAGPQNWRYILKSSNVPFTHVIIDGDGPNNPHTKAVGDIDGDGFIDVLAASSSGGPLLWYQYPNWTKHVVAPSGTWSTDAEVGDLDGDGDEDIVISEWYTKKRIEWYENPGPAENPAGGSWPVHVMGVPRAHDIEIGDLDGDGDVDVITRSQGSEGNQISIWQQHAPDSWTQRIITCPTGEGLSIGDIDKDGDLDIIIGGRWYEATGDIVDDPWAEHIIANWHPDAVVKMADMNKDGRPDIILTRSEGSYRMSWFEAPPNPRSGPWTEHLIDASIDYAHSLGIGDLDNDGDLDVVTAEMHQSPRDRVLVYLNQGDALTWEAQIVATTGSHGLRVADIGNDCDLDLIGANWSGSYQPIEMWKNLTRAERLSLDKSERQIVDPMKPWRTVFLTSPDVAGAGKNDIITGGWWYKNPSHGRVLLYDNKAIDGQIGPITQRLAPTATPAPMSNTLALCTELYLPLVRDGRST
jgi:hypothetical protein